MAERAASCPPPVFQSREGYGGGWPFSDVPDVERIRDNYDPSRYPVTQQMLDSSLVLFSQSCPLIAQSSATVDAYAEAFRKVWRHLPELAHNA